MPLEDENICREIVVLELEMLLAHLYTNRKMVVRYSPEVVQYIFDKGFDVEYGARPLKRALRKYFSDPLSQLLLTNDPGDGAIMTAVMKDGKIDFSVAEDGKYEGE